MRVEQLDRRQLRELVRVGFKTEVRGASNPLGGMTKKASGFPPLAGVLIFYFLISLVLAAVVIKSPDLFTSMLLLCSSVMTFVAITILLEYSQTILTPEEYTVIGPHPVNSRTFFVAKLVNLVVFVGMLALALGLASSVAAAVVNSRALLAPMVLLTVICTALATATFFVIFYALMLHISSRERMNSILGYLQLVLIFGFYAMMLVLPHHLDAVANALASVQGWYLYLLPSAWFASWPALLFDGVTAPRAIAAAVGLLLMPLSYLFALSRLSLAYARSLNENVSRAEAVPDHEPGLFSRVRRRLTNPEERVVSRLIRAQFKHDNRYKVTVLSVLPLVGLYLYLGAQDGKSLIDPFVTSRAADTEPNVLFYFAVGMVPLLAIAGTSYSSAYQAAWIFFATPADRVRLVLATKRFATLYFCIPFVFLVFLIQAYFFGNVLHSALHSITLLLTCMIVVTIMVMMLGKVPFSIPVRRGQTTGLYIVSFMVPLALIMPPLIIIAQAGYGGFSGYLIWVAGLLAVNLILNTVQKYVIARRVARYEHHSR